MVQRQIKLNETGDVKEFVNEASKYEFDIDVFTTESSLMRSQSLEF